MKDRAYHLEQAEHWLAKAEEVESTPRCHLTKSYASMALGHIELAKLAADTQATGPVFQREWPDNVVWATTVRHQMGDISREEGGYFYVSGETRDHYIGNWVEGLGMVDAKAFKDHTRPLTPEEWKRLATGQVVIV